MISDCRVDGRSPDHAIDGKAVCLHLAGEQDALNQQQAYHEGCVVRNCLVDGGGLSKDVRGLSASGSIGAIFERNRVLNCLYGASLITPASGTDIHANRDVVFWDNYFSFVRFGIHVETTGDQFVSRVIMERNIIEVSETAGAPEGIRARDAFAVWVTEYAVARWNVVRPVAGESLTSSAVGILLELCMRSVISHNVVSGFAANKGVRLSSAYEAVTCFNNRADSGELIRGYDATNSKHFQEFTNQVEDVLIGV